MYVLGIDLQEGFANDRVVITLDGREIYREDAVTTKLLLGYAQTLTVDAPEGPARLTVALPDRGLENTVSLPLNADTYVGVSVTSQGVEFIVASAPFFYQ